MMHIETGYVDITIHSELILRINSDSGIISEPNDKIPYKLEEGRIYKFCIKRHHLYPIGKTIQLYRSDVSLDAPESILNQNKRKIGSASVLEVRLTASGGMPITTGEYMVIKLLEESKRE